MKAKMKPTPSTAVQTRRRPEKECLEKIQPWPSVSDFLKSAHLRVILMGVNLHHFERFNTAQLIV